MNEQDARARMVADITASLTPDMPLRRLAHLHQIHGNDPIQIDGEHPTKPVGAEFRRAWDAGDDIKAIAHQFGVNESTVSRWALTAGLKKRHGRKARAVKAGKAFREAWLAGLPTSKIAKVINVSESTVRLAARRDRLPKRDRKGQPIQQFKGAAE